ncbi:hypothetical protein PAXRUDRAFT_20947 [Paxillus rubicundulus Ve08.2h10]|uniref:Uncharacterized protein n=1 Tax=Paxillus rubicundulus Ve08.2h10 TaxID=930991 RepID=A0A0D0BP90_9AGAM|nr:hypothetical protein PAXRUDRAFT_20947 [Paxillus rubicundulus Ve08.2h10]
MSIILPACSLGVWNNPDKTYWALALNLGSVLLKILSRSNPPHNRLSHSPRPSSVQARSL